MSTNSRHNTKAYVFDKFMKNHTNGHDTLKWLIFLKYFTLSKCQYLRLNKGYASWCGSKEF